MSIYLDYNATSPVMSEVAELVNKLMLAEYGNAGSRTHTFGAKAKQYVEKARAQVAVVVDADKSEVIFTSGATESNNIAILGLQDFAKESGKRHIITTTIEHKAVLEPIEELGKRGFDITYISVDSSGVVDPIDVQNALRDDTVLVSIMQVNNETGCIQPLKKICNVLGDHEAFLHVDAAQGFGKLCVGLDNKRIDFISASAHKIYAPKGVGALIVRKRGFLRPPLKPLMFGGGQEKGLRPGTLPVQLIAGFGLACEIASRDSQAWQKHAMNLKNSLIKELDKLGAQYNGKNTSPFVLNFSIPGVNSEAAMVRLKEVVAFSNGSACTSSSYIPSHVLVSMGLDREIIDASMRVSWSHMTEKIPLSQLITQFRKVRI